MSLPADLFNAAVQHHQAGRLLEAERLYEALLHQHPDQANVMYLLGLANHQRGNLAGAIRWYQHAIALQPNYADAHNNLGVLYVQQGQLQAAVRHYQAALQGNPNNPHVHANLGVILQQLEQFEAAIAHYQTAIQLEPNFATAHTNLGHALKEMGQLDAAIVHYRVAQQLMPTNPDAYRDLGDALQEQEQFPAALAIYDRALSLAPNHLELNGGRIRALLISGNLLDGFRDYDRWRLGISVQPHLNQPVWDGSPLNGQSILLSAEAGSGFGDSIQFIRYATLVANLGGHVLIECQPPLVRLFQTVVGVAQVISTGKALPAFVTQASLLSLPRIFGTTLATIPQQIPYLHGSESGELLLPSMAFSSTVFKVGIVWGGDPKHNHDRERSCPFVEFLTFLRIPGVEFYSLQKGEHRSELQLDGLSVIDVSDRLHDFADTAALIAQLDLVITVDTAVAHLAGALGKPVWILLSFAADWRWLTSRQDSPWYLTARLFRQAQRRDWAGVCQQVAIALQDLASP